MVKSILENAYFRPRWTIYRVTFVIQICCEKIYPCCGNRPKFRDTCIHFSWNTFLIYYRRHVIKGLKMLAHTTSCITNVNQLLNPSHYFQRTESCWRGQGNSILGNKVLKKILFRQSKLKCGKEKQGQLQFLIEWNLHRNSLIFHLACSIGLLKINIWLIANQISILSYSHGSPYLEINL